jgi:DNA-binding NarL/FixJ family response regulator
VAILDMRLPDGDGVQVCREVRSRAPEVACLILTSFGDDEALVSAVRTVAAGQSLLDPQAAGRLMARLRDQPKKADPLAGLTPQERRILELIGEGLTNRQIGERVFPAEKTVKNHVSVLFDKLGLQRRTQAAALAARVFDGEAGA